MTHLQALCTFSTIHIPNTVALWRTQGGGEGSQDATLPSTPDPRKQNFKYMGFVETMISMVMRGLRFSLNQALKWADDWWCIGI